MTEASCTVARRLSMLVVATPWPVVFWFQTLPDWNGGGHGANALAGISAAVGPMILGTMALGFVVALVGRRGWIDVSGWIVFAFFHHVLLIEYIAANTAWYS